jgi:methyl-accepting chemotaxis protein
MDRQSFALWMAVIGNLCWIVCFVWMNRISRAQNSLLNRLQDQTQRIEKLTKVEHDLIKDVHPKVGEINKDIQEMKAAVKENTENNAQAAEALKKMQ